ncbi:MAG: Mur ligase family protein [Desulfovibrionaceae bacterium]|nr:Mur ligase family protein [Desulfovibrionaceae bacterium]
MLLPHAVVKDWPEFSALLDRLGMFHIHPGLKRMEKALERLRLTRLTRPLAQVAGTNGKGSTCAFMASLARAHGLSCFLHTSPHFVSVRERLRLARPGGPDEGEPLPEKAWLEAAEAVLNGSGEDLTYFELITAMAAWMLEKTDADLTVMESGLGGSLDAVTALAADLVIFTPIGLDHCEILGNSIEAIAADKAGAIRHGRPAITARQLPEAMAAIEREALRKAAPLYLAPKLPENFFTDGGSLGLAGEHQQENAALALAAWRHMAAGLLKDYAPPAGGSISEEERKGLAAAWTPGRLQCIQPQDGLPAMILDGGHNPHGLAALGLSLARMGLAPGAVIFSCLNDKQPEKILPHLRALAAGGPIFVPLIQDHPKAMPPAALAELIGLAATPLPDLPAALEAARQYFRRRLPEEARPYINPEPPPGRHPLLICGSLYLLGEFYALHPQCLHKENPPRPRRRVQTGETP